MRKDKKKNRKAKRTVSVKDLAPRPKGGASIRGGAINYAKLNIKESATD
jgi:hypothetical protein